MNFGPCDAKMSKLQSVKNLFRRKPFEYKVEIFNSFEREIRKQPLGDMSSRPVPTNDTKPPLSILHVSIS